MIEFRWMAFLALWSLLIGPVLDIAQKTPPGQQAGAKAPASKVTSR